MSEEASTTEGQQVTKLDKDISRRDALKLGILRAGAGLLAASPLAAIAISRSQEGEQRPQDELMQAFLELKNTPANNMNRGILLYANVAEKAAVEKNLDSRINSIVIKAINVDDRLSDLKGIDFVFSREKGGPGKGGYVNNKAYGSGGAMDSDPAHYLRSFHYKDISYLSMELNSTPIAVEEKVDSLPNAHLRATTRIHVQGEEQSVQEELTLYTPNSEPVIQDQNKILLRRYTVYNTGKLDSIQYGMYIHDNLGNVKALKEVKQYDNGKLINIGKEKEEIVALFNSTNSMLNF